MGTANTVLSKMIENSVLAMETGQPILFLKTANVEMVHRVISDNRFSALCPELTKTDDGWAYMTEDCTTADRFKARNERRSNYRFMDSSTIKEDIDKFLEDSMSFEKIEAPQLMIVKVEYSYDKKSDALWRSLTRFINFYTADLCRETPVGRSRIILYGTIANIPDDFMLYGYVVEEDYPEREELAELVDRHLEASEEIKTMLTDRLKGFTLLHVERILTYIKNSSLSEKKIYEFIQNEKEQCLKKSDLLELVKPNDKVCRGMDKFSRLIADIKPLLQNVEQVKLEIDCDSPKGFLLCGVPGTGKSVAANMFAQQTGLPMVKMDIGKLMGSFVGESEHNMQNALKLADALAPCIVFIDELDKGFEGAKAGSNKSGSDTTFRRMFASLLLWMQEHKKPCFIFATANDISNLPKEFFRSGRFDCLYSVQMPRYRECVDILAYQMERHNAHRFFAFDPIEKSKEIMDVLTEGSVRFVTGADIEKIVDFTARKLWREGKRTKVSYKEWESSFKEVLKNTSVYGDGNEQKDSIAFCYIRLIRNNFEPISDDPLLSSRDYVVKTVKEREPKGADNGLLPDFSVALPSAKFASEVFNLPKNSEQEYEQEECDSPRTSLKVFDNKYDFELYKMIAQRIYLYAPAYEKKALNLQL